jgi:hypothetical protein
MFDYRGALLRRNRSSMVKLLDFLSAAFVSHSLRVSIPASTRVRTNYVSGGLSA